MADGPFGVVRERVDFFNRHHRTFKGTHAVEGEGDEKEADDGVGDEFVPGAGEGHHAVNHAAPRRYPEDDGKGHAERLRPVRQGGVVQVVRSRPHIDGNQRPEVDDGEAVGVNRAAGLFRHEVVHHAEEGGGKEETDGVVAVPPLRHRIDRAGVHGIGMQPVNRQGEVVEDVQHGDGDDVSAVEPEADVDMFFLALADGEEEDVGIGNPDDREQDIEQPGQFRVFLALRVAEDVAQYAQYQHGLIAVEGEGGDFVGNEANAADALHDVVRCRKERVAAEGENHAAGVHRAQASVRQEINAAKEGRPAQLRGDDDADQHADDAKNNRRPGELFDDAVVIGCIHSHQDYLIMFNLYKKGIPGMPER